MMVVSFCDQGEDKTRAAWTGSAYIYLHRRDDLHLRGPRRLLVHLPSPHDSSPAADHQRAEANPLGNNAQNQPHLHFKQDIHVANKRFYGL